MKWFKLSLCILVAALSLSVPAGCQKKAITDLQAVEAPPEGHQAAAQKGLEQSQQGMQKTPGR